MFSAFARTCCQSVLLHAAGAVSRHEKQMPFPLPQVLSGFPLWFRNGKLLPHLCKRQLGQPLAFYATFSLSSLLLDLAERGKRAFKTAPPAAAMVTAIDSLLRRLHTSIEENLGVADKIKHRPALASRTAQE